MDRRHHGGSRLSKRTVRDPTEGADTVESVHCGAIVRDVYPSVRLLVAKSARFVVDRQPDRGAFHDEPEFVVSVDCRG